MLSLILFALIATSVNGQGPQCIPGAFVNGMGQCECVNSGDPNLCCFNPVFDKSCRVAGDPVMTSYAGEKMALDFPCGTKVSSTQVPGTCGIDVYTASRLIRHGTYYTSRVKIRIGGGAVDIDISTYDRLVYRNGGPSTSLILNEVDSIIGSNGLATADILAKRDRYGRIVIVACQQTIVVKLDDGSGINQKTTGLCIVAPREAVVGDSVCEVDANLRFLTNRQYLDFAIRPMKDYVIDIDNVRQGITTEINFCFHFRRISIAACTDQHRNDAYRTCAHLVFHPTIRRCMIGDTMGHFDHCLATYCTGQKTFCDAIKNSKLWSRCVPGLAECDTWPRYREVNSVVAGEGEGNNVQFGGETTQAPKQATTEFVLGDEEILGGESTQAPEINEEFDLGGDEFF